jgi:hypothetical protein
MKGKGCSGMEFNMGFELKERQGVWYCVIPSFERTGLVSHGFSTRKGGVSGQQYSTLNLGFKKGDSCDAVMQNFLRFCRALDINPHNTVFSDQVHSDKVAVVGAGDRGKGAFKESDILQVDGLMTQEPQVALVTFYADCVPLFFLDPVRRAIALSHAGWRGTIARIGAKTLEGMRRMFGTRPEECLIGIGPSIGPCCFEVDFPVAEQFAKVFDKYKDIIIKPGQKPGRYYVNLWMANALQLEEMGIPHHNITVADMCTSCNHDLFFSHRRDKGNTGRMAALLMLKG